VFHAENTRSLETFTAELNLFKTKVAPNPVESFTKHGSGVLKLGRHHYPAYEPEKYKQWAVQTATRFDFGNGIATWEAELFAADGFYANMFWIERDYRAPEFNELQQALDAAKKADVVVLIHPCNFHSSAIVSDNFKQLAELAQAQDVAWKVY